MTENQDLPKIVLNHYYQYIQHLWTTNQKKALQNSMQFSFSGTPGPKEIIIGSFSLRQQNLYLFWTTVFLCTCYVMNWQLTQDFQISLISRWATTTAKSYPNGCTTTCCTPRDKEKIWQKEDFRRTVYSFIWLMFSLNLRNVVQIQDKCSKPKVTQSFVKTREHHEFTSEAMKSFKSCQSNNTSNKVYCLLKRVNMHTDIIPQHILYFHLITNYCNLTLGTKFKVHFHF